jgi:hypothetical protein
MLQPQYRGHCPDVQLAATYRECLEIYAPPLMHQQYCPIPLEFSRLHYKHNLLSMLDTGQGADIGRWW